MKKHITRLVTLILLLSVGTQSISQASEPASAKGRPVEDPGQSGAVKEVPMAEAHKPGPTPEELANAHRLLGKCDKALTSCDVLLHDKDEKIRQQDEILKTADKELANMKSDRDNLLKNPILWGVIGFAVGALAAGAIASRR